MRKQVESPERCKSKTPVEQEFKEVYERFEEVKQRYNYIDFDDILLETYYMLENNAPLLTQLQQRFHYIEVDEFQDTSYAQYEIVKLLASPRNNLFIAGDDDRRYMAGEEQVTKLFYLSQKNLITLQLLHLIRIIDPTLLLSDLEMKLSN